MSGKTATGTGGKFAYCEHAWQTKANASLVKKAFDCFPARIQVDRIEKVVWSEFEKSLLDKSMAKELLNEANELWIEALRESPQEKIKKKISTIKLQLAAFAEMISQLPGNFDATPLLTQLGKL